MRFDPTHFEPLSATPAKPRLAPLTSLPASPRLPWKEAPFATPAARTGRASGRIVLKTARKPGKAAARTVAMARPAMAPAATPDAQPSPAAALSPAASAALSPATLARNALRPSLQAREAASPETPNSAKLGRAELRTLLAIDLEGGEVCVRREGERLRYERVDACGDVLERYPGATVRALIAAGHLRLRRCAHGGNVYAVAGDPVGRAGYRSRPERAGASLRQPSPSFPRQ